jgi:hypothetical protein
VSPLQTVYSACWQAWLGCVARAAALDRAGRCCLLSLVGTLAPFLSSLGQTRIRQHGGLNASMPVHLILAAAALRDE